MKRLLLLVLNVAMVTILVANDVIFGKQTAKGTFKYNGIECKWHEKRETGSIRSLNIQCKKTFTSKYEGDPHKCNWYKDGNQLEYYKCLVGALKRDKFDGNSPSQVSCTKKNCDDVVFKKVSSHLHNVYMKEMNVEQEMMEIEEPEWDEFDDITRFN